MASVPFIVLIYDGPLVCGFNVAIRGLIGLVGVNISDFFYNESGTAADTVCDGILGVNEFVVVVVYWQTGADPENEVGGTTLGMKQILVQRPEVEQQIM